MAKHIDATTKQLFDLGPAAWLAVAGLPVPTGGRAAMLDADLSTLSVAADKLIRIDAGPASAVVHIEMQVNPDPGFDARMAMYNAVARWRFGLPVWSVALLMRPEVGRTGMTGRVDDRAADDLSLAFAYRRVRVWELPVEPLLTGPISTVPLAPVAAVSRADLPAVIERVRQRVMATPVAAFGGENPPDLWLATVRLLASRYPMRFLETLMLDLMNPPEGTALWEIREMGREAGREEGRIEVFRRAVGRTGTRRFGPPPPDVQARLASITDAAAMDRTFDRLDTAAGWTDLLAD